MPKARIVSERASGFGHNLLTCDRGLLIPILTESSKANHPARSIRLRKDRMS